MKLLFLIVYIATVVQDVKGLYDPCTCTSRVSDPICGEPSNRKGPLIEFKNFCAFNLYNCNNKQTTYVIKFYGFCDSSSKYVSHPPPKAAIAMLSASYVSGSLDSKKAKSAKSTVKSSSSKSSKPSNSFSAKIPAPQLPAHKSYSIPAAVLPGPLPAISSYKPIHPIISVKVYSQSSTSSPAPPARGHHHHHRHHRGHNKNKKYRQIGSRNGHKLHQVHTHRHRYYKFSPSARPEKASSSASRTSNTLLQLHSASLVSSLSSSASSSAGSSAGSSSPSTSGSTASSS